MLFVILLKKKKERERGKKRNINHIALSITCVTLQMDPELDRNISDHVLRMHRYRSPNEQDGDGKIFF